MKRREYRIIQDRYGEYMPQVRGWFGWFSLRSGGYGFLKLESAEAFARRHADPVVKLLGKLP